jgi:TetR/AcrR family transcriptional regulator, repressor for uid operon
MGNLMIYCEKQNSGKRDIILHAARKCFVQHGFHATGMAEICLAAGMSAGNLYRYFPNKAAIIRTIVDETRNRIVPFYKSLESCENPVEGIVQIILHSVKEFGHDSIARLWVEILGESSRNEEMRKLCIAFDRKVRNSLKKLLRRAVKANKCLEKMDIEAASVWLVALLDGAIARLSLDPQIDLLRILNTLAASIRHLLNMGTGMEFAALQSVHAK